MDFEILSDEQLIGALYMRNYLLHSFGKLLNNDMGYDQLLEYKNELELMDNAINSYIQKSENCFPIQCLGFYLISPQETCEIKTNISGSCLNDATVILNGELDCDGYISLSYEDKEGEKIISVKNNIKELPGEDLYATMERVKNHYYNAHFEYGTSSYLGHYTLHEYTNVGVGHSKDKELVKSIKDRGYRF